MAGDLERLIIDAQVISPAVEVTAWRGGEPLGTVPVAQGQASADAGGDLLGQMEITVPASPEWLPTDPGHALAPYGQQLIVRRGFTHPAGGTVGWEILGAYRIRDTQPDGTGWITVLADSGDILLTLARWLVATRTSGTYAAQAAQICAGIVSIRVEAPDRAAPDRTWEQQQPRRESLMELCDAWGTVLRMVDGQLTILPAPTGTTPTRVLQPSSGLMGVTPSTAATSTLTPNAVVASSAPTDETAPVSAMAAIAHGPRAWGGPYGQIPQFFGSPLLTTVGQCQEAARTRLARLQTTGADLTVEAVTDPSWQLDEIVRVIEPDSDTDVTVRTTGITWALTPGREPGGITGLVLSGRVRGIPR